MKRMHAAHTITSYVLVPSVTRHMAKEKKLGGNICKPKTTAPTCTTRAHAFQRRARYYGQFG